MTYPFTFLLLAAIQIRTAVQTNSNGYLNIDLAVIVHEEARSEILEMLRVIPSFFLEAPDESRVGFIVSWPSTDFVIEKPGGAFLRSGKWTVLMNLTGNTDEYEKRKSEIMHDIIGMQGVSKEFRDKSWLDAFKLAEERLFIKEPDKIPRPRIILFLTDPDEAKLDTSLPIDPSSLSEASNMRERGIHMFALYQRHGKPKIDKEEVYRLTTILGDRRNLEHVNMQELNPGFGWLKRRIAAVLCGLEQRCFFHEPQNQCQKAWYTPNVTDAQGNCTSVRGFISPSSNEPDDKPCSVNECEATCDDLWPTNCSESNCGKEPREKLPRWEQLLNCDRSVKCSPCPIIQTPSPQDPQDPKSTTTCYEKNPPEFYYDGFDGARSNAHACAWVILVAVLFVIARRTSALIEQDDLFFDF